MYYKDLSNETWGQLDRTGDSQSGYKSIDLKDKDNRSDGLHIFNSEDGKLHFVIADQSGKKSDIYDPAVNGLTIKLKEYRLKNSGVQKFIDLECGLNAYSEEFTEIVKEISEKILAEDSSPVTAVNEVISSWKSFWSNRPKEILSDEEQIGLLCELKVFKLLSQIDPNQALTAWKGPLGEKYDFLLPEKVLEVKGTRSDKRIHRINGIDQLLAPEGKQLFIISYLASKNQNQSSLCLPNLIQKIESDVLNNYAPDVIKFRKLLSHTGYSPIHNDKYQQYRFEIYDGFVYQIDDDFPKLTNKELSQPLSSRIIDISYNIELEGLPSKKIDEFSF